MFAHFRFIAFFLALAAPAWAQPANTELTPLEFKAALLAKIPAYIEWPAQSGASSTLTIGILGDDPITDILQRVIHGKKIGGREVAVKTFSGAAAIEKCEILYVPEKAFEQWSEWSKTANTHGVVTIGEHEDFFKTGGVFSFSVADRILQIHLRNAKKAGVDINSKLLKVSKVIK